MSSFYINKIYEFEKSLRDFKKWFSEEILRGDFIYKNEYSVCLDDSLNENEVSSKPWMHMSQVITVWEKFYGVDISQLNFADLLNALESSGVKVVDD